MTYPTTDMYTTVERSIYQKLKATIAAASLTYSVFNNMVDKKKFPDLHASISVMKVSDVFTAENGGGARAFLDTPIKDGGGNITGYNREIWPDSYDLLYQIESSADNLDDLRKLETIIRVALRPRQTLFLWDSNAVPPAFTSEWIEYHYAGYINRDIPADNIYNRILNIRFDARNIQPTTVIPAITEIDTLLATVDATEVTVAIPVQPSQVVIGTPVEITGEDITLLPDGVTGALEHTPVPGTLRLYVGGLRVNITDDYTVDGNEFTLLIQPPADSVIVADYTYLQP